MEKKLKRALVTISPEWEPALDRLKQDKFYNDTQAEMYRQLIQRGLKTFQAENAHGGRQQREST
jgi:hypothetical protein